MSSSLPRIQVGREVGGGRWRHEGTRRRARVDGGGLAVGAVSTVTRATLPGRWARGIPCASWGSCAASAWVGSPFHPRAPGAGRPSTSSRSMRSSAGPGTQARWPGRWVVGDAIGDPRHHGGDEQAVYAVARGARLVGSRAGPGPAGQDVGEPATGGLDVDAAVIGTTWAIGSGGPPWRTADPAERSPGTWVSSDGSSAFNGAAGPAPTWRRSASRIQRRGRDPGAEVPAHGVTVPAICSERSWRPRPGQADPSPGSGVGDAARRTGGPTVGSAGISRRGGHGR